MSDELTETTAAPEVEVEAPEAPEVQTEENPDAELIAKLKSLDPETLKNLDNLDEFYKRVNRKSMEAAELRKQAEAMLATAPSPKAATVDDDDEELDERAQRIIDKRIKRIMESELAPVFSTMVEERKEAEQHVWEDFTSSHTDVPADAIAEAFYELGFDKTANTPAKYADAIKKAYRYAKANDLEALAEAKAVEKLAALKDKGDEVVAVKEKKSGIEPAPKSELDLMNDPDIPWYQKFASINKG